MFLLLLFIFFLMSHLALALFHVLQRYWKLRVPLVWLFMFNFNLFCRFWLALLIFAWYLLLYLCLYIVAWLYFRRFFLTLNFIFWLNLGLLFRRRLVMIFLLNRRIECFKGVYETTFDVLLFYFESVIMFFNIHFVFILLLVSWSFFILAIWFLWFVFFRVVANSFCLRNWLLYLHAC